MRNAELVRRAVTLKKKADELFSLVYAKFGEDDFASDLADNLTCAADDLIEHLADAQPPSVSPLSSEEKTS